MIESPMSEVAKVLQDCTVVVIAVPVPMIRAAAMIYFFIDLFLGFFKNCTKGKYYSHINKILNFDTVFGELFSENIDFIIKEMIVI